MKNSCLPLALRSLTDPSDAKNAAKELERFVVKCLAPNADVRRALHRPPRAHLDAPQVHDFTGTLCAPVSSEDKDASDSGQDAAEKLHTDGGGAPSSPSKFAAAAKGARETLTQLGIKNFAQRGA
jgi:hypothetical protein